MPGFMVPLKQIEYGFGSIIIIIRSPYTPYSIYLRGTIGFGVLGSHPTSSPQTVGYTENGPSIMCFSKALSSNTM